MKYNSTCRLSECTKVIAAIVTLSFVLTTTARLSGGGGGGEHEESGTVLIETSQWLDSFDLREDGFLELSSSLEAAHTSKSTGRQRAVLPVHVHQQPPENCTAPDYTWIASSPNVFYSPADILAAGLTFDAIVIPSGGLEADGALPNEPTRARLDAAGQLNGTTAYWVSSGAYSPNVPPRISEGRIIGEGRADAMYLMDKWRPAGNIILEEIARDTLGNAFFTRLICEKLELKRLLVITNRFHFARAKVAFDWVLALPPRMPFETFYLEVPDVGLKPRVLQARVQKEAESLFYLWCKTRPRISNLKELATNIYLEHKAYALDTSKSDYQITVGDDAKESY